MGDEGRVGRDIVNMFPIVINIQFLTLQALDIILFCFNHIFPLKLFQGGNFIEAQPANQACAVKALFFLGKKFSHNNIRHLLFRNIFQINRIAGYNNPLSGKISNFWFVRASR
jgi:hypothetical protein